MIYKKVKADNCDFCGISIYDDRIRDSFDIISFNVYQLKACPNCYSSCLLVIDSLMRDNLNYDTPIEEDFKRVFKKILK